ncbi:MAG: flagellar biosynthetic protein FliO [Gammaproteobacteria bacterium]|nr:flagellar biosynthetic protein FliO [Gammaproteobacteria bacterium]
MRHPRTRIVLACAALAPGLCAAASSAPVGFGQAVQVILGLVLVLGMIVAAAWGARRLQAIRPQGRGHIRIVEGLAVGTRDKLLLVEVDGQRVLLGMSPGRIATLHTFSAEGSPQFDDALRAAGQQLLGAKP